MRMPVKIRHVEKYIKRKKQSTDFHEVATIFSHFIKA